MSSVQPLVDAAGGRRSPATMPGVPRRQGTKETRGSAIQLTHRPSSRYRSPQQQQRFRSAACSPLREPRIAAGAVRTRLLRSARRAFLTASGATMAARARSGVVRAPRGTRL